MCTSIYDVAVYFQPTYTILIYLGRFYVRLEVTNKSLPDDYVGKELLYGQIIHTENFDLT